MSDLLCMHDTGYNRDLLCVGRTFKGLYAVKSDIWVALMPQLNVFALVCRPALPSPQDNVTADTF